MKVKIFAFEFEYSAGYTIDEFFSYIEQRQTIESSDHIVAVQRQGDFWVGLFVTIKDQKAFCRFRRIKKHFALIPENLGEDNIAEFNHFIVNSATSRGLYQWYHQSGGVGGFCSFLRPFYIAERDKKKAAALASKSTEAEKLKEKKLYGVGLRSNILCRSENFESRIRSLDRVKTLEFSLKTYVPEKGDPMSPLSRFMKSKKEIVTFEKKVGVVAGVANVVRSLVKDVKNIKVEGVDPDGHDQIYKLLNDHDVFEEYDYDSILENMKIDSSDLNTALGESEVIKRMVEVAGDKASRLLNGRTRK